MIEAGLGSMPGGGAEIFHPEVRRQICEHKADATPWIEIHRTAHELGLRTNATMLYGHIENAYHRIDHLLRLRELQDETGGFQTFIPLAFHPDNTRLDHIKKPSSLMDLRTMAVSRLMLDNFDHVKAYWIMLGVETAQIALSYGADDIDGTVRHELIYHDAGAVTPEALSVEEIRRLIVEAGRDPVERDTLYRRVARGRGTERSGKWKIELAAHGENHNTTRREQRKSSERRGADCSIGAVDAADEDFLRRLAVVRRVSGRGGSGWRGVVRRRRGRRHGGVDRAGDGAVGMVVRRREDAFLVQR
jgi:hypothetical protein